jgi:carbon-monoxide dehydrogenase medium subunit
MTAPDLLQPSSPEEAVSLFEAGMIVIGGGTIVVPELTSGTLRPERAMLLTGAGLSGITRDGPRITIGATTPVSELETLPAPIGPCAANVADIEIRAQGTVGGNLCAGAGPEAPRGDLQGALLAVGATVRSTGAGGETTEPLEDFLPQRKDRLLLDVSFEEPAAGAFAALIRPHTHDYTALAVSAARDADGTVRLAVTGVASHAVRLPSA